MNRVSNVRQMFLSSILLSALVTVDIELASATGFITPGSQRASAGGTTGVSSGTEFRLYLEAARSYACTVIPADSTTTLQLSTTVVGPSGNVSAAARGDYTPVVTAASASEAALMRVALTPSQSGLHTFSVSSATGTEIVRPECVETTLYGGYNTSVSTFNFLEMTNISNKPILVKVTATNYDGNVVINGGQFSIPAGQRVDVDIHSPAGPGVFGSLKLSHDGPLGAVQANLSQYVGSISDFYLAVSIPLVPRDQNI